MAPITIDRNGEIIELKVELLPSQDQESVKEESVIEEEISNEKSSELLGISVTDLTDNLRKEFKISDNVNGLFINDVEITSLAYRMGLRKGAVLLSINRQNIRSTEEFEETISRLKKGQSVALYVYIPGEGSLMLSYPLQ